MEVIDEKKPRFQLQSAADLLTKPMPALEWLINGIWVDKSRGLLAGNPNVGKTWLALDMLISVASGQLCMGKFGVKQGPVLLVEEEASELNLARRIHCLARARGLKDSDLTNFFHITRQFPKVPRDTKELVHLMIQEGIILVVFDSLRRFHGANENDSAEMQAVLDSFGTINTYTYASVILIHHLSKSNDLSSKPLFERLRGSSDLWAWRDCLIGVESDEESDLSTCSFQFRDAEATLPITVKRCMDGASGAIRLVAGSLEDREDVADKINLITAWMKTQLGSVSKNKIVDGVKGKRRDILRILKVMEQKGIIVENGSGFNLNDA